MTAGLSRARWIAHSALYLALAVVLPMAFHYFGNAIGYGIAGRVLLPMHIPVLIAGFLVGPASGVVVGMLAPVISYLLTQMPPPYAVPLMSMELPIYGLVAGMAYNRLKLNIYIALIAAMVFGRIMFGLGLFVLGLFMDLPYSAAKWFSTGGAIISGLPGIALQLVLIPILVAAVKRGKRPE
jgi:riboflavin transporter FmnP